MTYVDMLLATNKQIVVQQTGLCDEVLTCQSTTLHKMIDVENGLWNGTPRYTFDEINKVANWKQKFCNSNQ